MPALPSLLARAPHPVVLFCIVPRIKNKVLRPRALIYDFIGLMRPAALCECICPNLGHMQGLSAIYSNPEAFSLFWEASLIIKRPRSIYLRFYHETVQQYVMFD